MKVIFEYVTEEEIHVDDLTLDQYLLLIKDSIIYLYTEDATIIGLDGVVEDEVDLENHDSSYKLILENYDKIYAFGDLEALYYQLFKELKKLGYHKPKVDKDEK